MKSLLKLNKETIRSLKTRTSLKGGAAPPAFSDPEVSVCATEAEHGCASAACRTKLQ